MTPTSLVLSAPAKINLFLHVTGRRDDGYHLLESVFTLVSLADTVRLTLRQDGHVRLLNASAGLTENNDLACRAARALQVACASKLGVDIELTKRIPQGAGLGGGSSDAATTLLGLNRLWALAQPREELQHIGATLGADVPFFVFGEPALVRGIGEQHETVTLPAQSVVIASPGVGVATGDVFGQPNLTRNTPGLKTAAFLPSYGRNDLQPVATLLQPKIEALRRCFIEAEVVPRMTGSGSCMFALTNGESKAKQLAATLAYGGWQCWSLRTVSRHPLYGFADGAII